MKKLVAVLVSMFVIGGVQAAAISSTPPNQTSTSIPKADSKAGNTIEQHIRDLHTKLKITPEEENQWAAVAQAMHDSATEIDRVVAKRDALVKSATAVDDLNAYSDIAQAHADGVKKVSLAFSPLYASMSENQKKLADTVFSQHLREGKRHANETK